MKQQLENSKCGFIALIGAPNAGKSTLLNRLVGVKVSIVSRKVQTTRALIRGIVMGDETQIIFVDTPGLFAPKRRLDKAMVTAAWHGAGDADLIALLVDVRRAGDEELQNILARLSEIKTKKVLILNKIDTLESVALLALSAKLNEQVAFEETFMISALKGHGTDALTPSLSAYMPKGPWLYPEDQASDMPMRDLAAEITREKIFERLHEELPYFTTVENESWVQEKDGSVRINQTIYVTRESHKKIVIGDNGQMIKSIGQSARRDLIEMLETKVHLFLFVKVREHWENDPARYKAMGLEFPKG